MKPAKTLLIEDMLYRALVKSVLQIMQRLHLDLQVL